MFEDLAERVQMWCWAAGYRLLQLETSAVQEIEPLYLKKWETFPLVLGAFQGSSAMFLEESGSDLNFSEEKYCGCGTKLIRRSKETNYLAGMTGGIVLQPLIRAAPAWAPRAAAAAPGAAAGRWRPRRRPRRRPM